MYMHADRIFTNHEERSTSKCRLREYLQITPKIKFQSIHRCCTLTHPIAVREWRVASEPIQSTLECHLCGSKEKLVEGEAR